MTAGLGAREPNRHKYAVLTAALLLLTGCATPYQPQGFSGGFTETKLAPDVVRVSFKGNRYTSPERANDFALLRAAELALEGGYSFIALLKAGNHIDNSTFTTEGTVPTAGDESGYDVRQAHYHAIPTYTPGETIDIRKPTSGILVQFLKGKSPALLSFDATFVVSSIRAKYKIQPSAGR